LVAKVRYFLLMQATRLSLFLYLATGRLLAQASSPHGRGAELVAEPRA
jgi:hypothetical protein